MPTPYSLDLRKRVVGFVEAAHSRHASAAHFGVSVSFVVKLMKNYQQTGSLAPKPSGGRRHSKLDPKRDGRVWQIRSGARTSASSVLVIW